MAAQLNGLSTSFSRSVLDTVAANHLRTAAAATAYDRLCQTSDFLKQEIDTLANEPGPSQAWLESWTNVDLLWWQARRPESEPAQFNKDVNLLWPIKFVLPAWRSEYPNVSTWVNKALTGEDYANVCSEAAHYKAAVLTELGKQLGLTLTAEFDQFHTAQATEGSGDWANAKAQFAAITTRTVRSALFKEARLKRLAMLTEAHVYSLPKGFQFDLKSTTYHQYEGSILGPLTRKISKVLPGSGLCFINDNTTNWLQLSAPLKHVYQDDPTFNVGVTITEDFPISWDGSSPLTFVFAFTPFPHHDTKNWLLFHTEPVATWNFSGGRGLFEFARQIGIDPSQLGFPYLEPSVEIQGQILPRNWSLNRTNLEKNLTAGQKAIKGMLDFPGK